MTDETLVRYLLDDLPAGDRAAVAAAVQTDPAAAAKLARLHAIIGELSEVEPVVPPAGLAVDAIARTAEYLVANGLFVPEAEPEVPCEPRPRAGRAARVLRRFGFGAEPVFFGGWRRADVAVAFSLGFLAAGLGLGAVGKLRADSQVRACQRNLMQLHAALSGYGDTHAGRMPHVGTPTVPVAAAVADELARSGQLWAPTVAACPVAQLTPAADPDEPAPRPSYAYTLGYRAANGTVIGPRYGDGPGRVSDATPVAADPPFGPHARGQNVLFGSGGVQFAASTAVGSETDNIYQNDAGFVRAGLHRLDAALGAGNAVP